MRGRWRSAVETGEERIAGCEVHDRPRVPERAAGRAREVDDGRGRAGSGGGGLHRDLLGAHLGVGNDPQHDVVGHIVGCAGQAEAEDRCPVSAGQWPWFVGKMDVGPRAAQRLENLLSRNRHGLYRNGVCR